ncbi:tetratricopeptide repeat protein [Sabulicella glaciei]|uniref:Tetratricopeptide repeat protein n=1 Tax=Sabulicella glaciei TaxID=2984948 RepID=A0ABT3NX77_9PROT|nr:tetratricopeptide repeat protein [Roseococcus sp. MDT2-1-1]
MSRVERLEALLKENRLEEAVTLAAESARAAPRDPETHNALGVVLARAGRYPEAERCYRAALRLDPRRGPIWSNLGNTLTAQGRDATAVAAQRRAVSLEPRNGTAFYNLATTLTRAERHGEAIPEYEEALRLGHPQAAWNLARARLAAGDLRRGFAEYECRLTTGLVPDRPRPGARWDGSRFEGKTLLLLTEQGFGDTIWILRYLTWVRERGGHVVLEAKPELAALAAPLVDEVVAPGAEVTADLHLHVCSLPGLFSPRVAPLPPLPPEEARLERLRPHMAGPGLKVGIIWSGSVTFGSNHWRAATLGRFLDAFLWPGVRLFSLQKGPPEAELAQHPQRAAVTDLAPHLRDFADTAAALSLLDLVIMTDSAVAHLAGTTNRPVWVLLGRAPHWLWLTGREDCPWYPSMRLFRMAPGPLAWDGVFDRASAALLERVPG